MRKILYAVLALLLIATFSHSDSEVTVGGKTGAAHIIQANGTSLRPRPYLNITGDSVTGVDYLGKTVITIDSVDDQVGAVTNNKWCVGDGTLVQCTEDEPAGGGGGASDTFQTWDLPDGDDIVADASTDTVTFTATEGISITGTAATDALVLGLTFKGHVTIDSAGAVGAQPDLITFFPAATPTTGDSIIFYDATDGALKEGDIDDVIEYGGGGGSGTDDLDDVSERGGSTDVAIDITATNNTTTPLTITGAASQLSPYFTIEDDSSNTVFTTYGSGHTYNTGGFRTEAEVDGVGLWVHAAGEATPEHSGVTGSYDHTGGTYEKLFTRTAGDTFEEADATDGNWILMTGANIGAIAEIKNYIDANNVVVSGTGWAGDLASQTFSIYKHPTFVSGDGYNHEFSVNSNGEFEVQSYNFTGSKMIKFENDVTADSVDTLHIKHEANGYSNSDMMQLFYETGALQAADESQVIQISVDETAAAGAGELDLLYLETTDATALEKHAIHVSVGFDSAFQVSGATADDMDYGYIYDPGSSPVSKVVGDDSFINTADDEELLSANGDFILIGNDAQFEILEIVLNPGSSKDLELEFYYSENEGTDNGVAGWVQFYPDDGTQGMTQSGLIDWTGFSAEWDEDDYGEDDADITEGYYIAIKRTRVGNPPVDAVEDVMQIYLSQSTGMNIDGLGVVQFPYLGAEPTGYEVNGKMWMEADGVHAYYAGSEVTLGTSAGLTSFVMEDGDGTEISISEAEEMKFVEGVGIDMDWTDTTPGSDADPFDLTVTFDGTIAEVDTTALTASEILITDGSKDIVSAAVATYPSLAELAYVKDVTSAIQTQFSGKEASLTTLAALSTALSNQAEVQFSFTITNGDTAIDASVTDPVVCSSRIANNVKITAWYLDCDQSGSIVLDVWKNTWNDTPLTNGDSIAGTEKPTLAGDVSASDTSLSSMTADWDAGEQVCVEIESAATVTKCRVAFYGYND